MGGMVWQGGGGLGGANVPTVEMGICKQARGVLTSAAHTQTRGGGHKDPCGNGLELERV